MFTGGAIIPLRMFKRFSTTTWFLCTTWMALLWLVSLFWVKRFIVRVSCNSCVFKRCFHFASGAGGSNFIFFDFELSCYSIQWLLCWWYWHSKSVPLVECPFHFSFCSPILYSSHSSPSRITYVVVWVNHAGYLKRAKFWAYRSTARGHRTSLVILRCFLDTIIDMNECDRGDHQCDRNAECMNTEGSYECKCRNGYEGDGKQCTSMSFKYFTKRSIIELIIKSAQLLCLLISDRFQSFFEDSL